MKWGIYRVRDDAIDGFMRPFPAETDAQALRSFADECKNPETPFAKHPEDYSLWKVCEITNDSVKDCQEHLGRATSFVEYKVEAVNAN